jgi:RNA polymerase sigma factor (sigma-70 family)
MIAQEQLSQQWLCDIYRQESKSLKYYAWKMTGNEVTAEEIVGDCFEKFLRREAKQTDQFPTPAHVKAFIATMVKNACLNWRSKKRLIMEDAPTEDIVDEGHMVLQLEKYDQLKQLKDLIDKLPTKTREVTHLFFIKGLSIREIAIKLGLPKESVSIYKTRAVKSLRAIVATMDTPFSEDLILFLIAWYIVAL